MLFEHIVKEKLASCMVHEYLHKQHWPNQKDVKKKYYTRLVVKVIGMNAKKRLFFWNRTLPDLCL
jgi:hypothetical protein